MGWKLRLFVSYQVRELEKFVSYCERLARLEVPGVGFIRSHGLGCPTLLSFSVSVFVPRAFPFFACGASLRDSRCRAGFRLTLFIEGILLPWGNH